MDVKLGLGNAPGMFYHAAAGTALPTSPSATPSAAWEEVGDVTDAGITLSLSKSVTNLKNWANVIKRVILTDHSETIKSPIMNTTMEALKTVVGSDNVTATTSSTAHRVVTVGLSDGELPPEEAFLWVMKDGNDMMMLGCSYGQVSAVDDISFAPGAAINWTPTITAMGDDGFKLIFDETTA